MKTFVTLLALVSAVIFLGCSSEGISGGSNQQIMQGNDQGNQDELKEPAVIEEEAELVELWLGALSSARSWEITIRHPDENVVFICTVDNGVFIFAPREQYPAKNVNAHSGDQFLWVSREWLNESTLLSHAFIEIILKLEQNIIGYVVIETNEYGKRSNFLKSVLFPQIDGKYQNVSEGYVKTAIEKIKAERLAFVEIETCDMVKIPRSIWNLAVSSPQGMIELKHPEENAVFECAAEKGFFSDGKDIQKDRDQQEIIVKPGGTILWHPSFKYPEQDFVNIILKIEDKIIGYAVIGINVFYGHNGFYELKLLRSALIPKVDGEYQNVTEEQINAAIERAKKGRETYEN
jgi:hypothetical protein